MLVGMLMNRIAVVAGGTLGHINPALSLIKTIKNTSPNAYIIFLATTKDEKYESLKMTAIDKIFYLKALGLSKSFIRNIKSLSCNYITSKKIKAILKDEKIEVVIGFGGYISGITAFVAHHLNIDVYLHEQNSYMGKANRYTYKYAKTIFISYPLINKNIKQEKLCLVGNPVYNDALEVRKKLYKQKNLILFTSGSLGAQSINDLAISFMNSPYHSNFEVIIVTGKKYYDNVIKGIKNKKCQILSFTDKLIELISKSEIVVTRAGSSTLFEIMGTKTVPIMIPSPNVSENHQYYNAFYFSEKNMGILLEEHNLTLDTFRDSINKIKNNYAEYLNNINKLNDSSITDKMIRRMCQDERKKI